MTDFDVEVSALRSDARAWDRAGQNLSGPIAAIRPLTLTPDDLPGDAAELHATYEKARANMEKLMRQAAQYFDLMGSGLLAVATEYEQADQSGARRFVRHQLGDNR